MFRAQLFRDVADALKTLPPSLSAFRAPPITLQRSFRASYISPGKSSASTASQSEEKDNEGSFAPTDSPLQVKYPENGDLPSRTTVQGRHEMSFKRTLASFSLEGRVAVVTGGARGLGLVMSKSLVMSGADVALVDLNKDKAAESAEELTASFRMENPGVNQMPNITAHYADVSSPESVDAAMAEILEQHGKIDNLVTSAGFTENFEAINYPIDRVRKLWGVNVDGTYLFATAVARHLMGRKTPGSMVFIGSMSGSIVNVPQPQAPYNASKAAVRHLAASLAVEWASAGIRVNCISPGYMLTALTKKILDDNPELKRQWVSLIPQGQMGQPEDLMGAVVFLSSDASRYVTGADLRVDGGYTLT